MSGHEQQPAPRNNRYQIRIEGILGVEWADWFDGMTITYDGNVTVLTGVVVDQAALHGLLSRVRDLSLTLISVGRTPPDQGDQRRRP